MDSVLNKSLRSLLLRLSEEDGPSVLWGRQAKPHLGLTFERLLSAGILMEQAPADLWPSCPDCDCGLDARPIQVIDDRIIAACPLDANNDAILDVDDLRSFVIDGRRLEETIIAGEPSLSLQETIPGLWHLGATPAGRALFLTLKHSTAGDPSLLTVMRATARGDGIALIAPPLRNDVERRLHDAGDVHVVLTAATLTLDDKSRWSIDMLRLDARKMEEPRLVIVESARQVTLDGVEKVLSEQPFRLLCLLAAQARTNAATVEIRDIEAHIWGAALHRITREARDVVRELRDALAKGSADPKTIRDLVESRRNPNGYRLALAPGDIIFQL